MYVCMYIYIYMYSTHVMYIYIYAYIYIYTHICIVLTSILTICSWHDDYDYHQDWAEPLEPSPGNLEALTNVIITTIYLYDY